MLPDSPEPGTEVVFHFEDGWLDGVLPLGTGQDLRGEV